MTLNKTLNHKLKTFNSELKIFNPKLRHLETKLKTFLLIKRNFQVVFFVSIIKTYFMILS
jgi:hypothetical protein